MRAAPPDDERWMRRALTLARRGAALTHPNPMVGALLVRNGRVVGSGFHTYDGLLHAEVLAIRQAGRRARGSTLYVNLEPCSHSGRTGPCTEAILEAGIRRVVAAMPDPNPLVSGGGFRRLRRRGLQVDVGAGRDRARRLNEAFTTWIRHGRPLVTLKTAATLDGQLALAAGARRDAARWVTSEASRGHVQRQRHAADALLTGIGTVLADDPLLTDRTGRRRRRPLLRVVLDSRLRLPLRSQIVRSARGDVLVYTLLSPASPRARRLNRLGVGVARVRARRGRIDLAAVLADLGRRGVLDVLVEAGPRLNGALLAAGLVDKLFLFYTPKILGRPTVPLATAARSAGPLASLTAVEIYRFGPDFALEGYLRDVYRDR